MNKKNIENPLTIEQPAHIDREEWTAEWEWFDEDIGNPLDGIERDWGWRCSKCGYILPDDFDDPDSPPKMKYCSACGRAMTPEAWAELEKRLRGCESGKIYKF